jgi:hypothetical protein
LPRPDRPTPKSETDKAIQEEEISPGHEHGTCAETSAVAEIKKSAWKGAPSINSPNAETVVEICGLVNFARTVGRDMDIFIGRKVRIEAKLDGKRPRKLYRLVHVTQQGRRHLLPYGEVWACWSRR